MVSANGFVYAVGGEGPFSEHDDIEVHCKYLQAIKKHLVCLNTPRPSILFRRGGGGRGCLVF